MKIPVRWIVLVGIIGICAAILPSWAEMENPGAVYQQAEEAYDGGQYRAAYNLFLNASGMFSLTGDEQMSRDALRKAKQASWIVAEFPYNRSTADEVITGTFPSFSVSERDELLGPGNSIQIVSDGEVWYYEGLARNILYHNSTLIRNSNLQGGESPFYDQILPLIQSEARNSHTFLATGNMSIPRDLLPASGTLKIWVPLPVETESQKNISVLITEPAEYVVSGPATSGNLGQIYFEIPLAEMTGPFLNVSVISRFTTSPRINEAQEGDEGEYDTGSEMYQRYTGSQPNINVSGEIRGLAEEIIGDERDPYTKASLIYDYIITTLPYSNVPHTYITAKGIPQSDFVHSTGFGDCGTQSAYFVALCRSVGIPARTCGGYQIVPGHAGTHFWAEYYLPSYGWQPVDVTVAEAGDWAFNATEEDRETYKQYFFGNLDPYRCTIQTDMDEPYTPETGPDTLLTFVHQKPSMECEASDQDIEMTGIIAWTYSFEDISNA